MRKCVALLVGLCALSLAQPNAPQNAEQDPCDKAVTFCWYGPYKDGSDEVKVWGNHWLANDQSKPIDFRTTFRCVKRLKVCMKAEVVIDEDVNMLRIQLLPVTKWSTETITADGEGAQLTLCSRDSYLISRVDKTTLMIASPGPQGDTPRCIAALGKPKTTIYRLTQ